MADHAMTFSGQMIRAILREIDQPGRGKTQTRRVLKPQPPESATAPYPWGEGPKPGHIVFQDMRGAALEPWPYAPGDRLWVKETWAVTSIYNGMTAAQINPERIPLYCGIRYAATQERVGIKDRSSRFMPRWASRLTLIVTDVRVQRLQDISEEDAVAEGIELNSETNAFWGAEGKGLQGATRQYTFASTAFHDVWDTLNDKRGFGTDENPWVCAITFTAHRRNIDQMEAAHA